jgi:hypothetical protein
MSHMRKEDEWLVFYADDQETEIGRIKPPEGGFTTAELEQFIEHIKCEARKKEHGPS